MRVFTVCIGASRIDSREYPGKRVRRDGLFKRISSRAIFFSRRNSLRRMFPTCSGREFGLISGTFCTRGS
jgi:hypothetical protein